MAKPIIEFQIGASAAAFKNTMGYVRSEGAKTARETEGSFEGMAKKVAGAGAAFASFATAAASIYYVANGVKELTDYAGKMSDLAARTGIGVKQTVILGQAFKNAGMDSSAMGGAINRLQKAIQGVNEDGEPTTNIFRRLGLSLYQLQQLSPDQQFELVGRSIAALGSDSEKTAAAMAVFGKSGGELLAIFKDPAAFETARKQVGGLGDELDKNAASFDAFSDAVGGLELKKMQLFAGIVSAFVGDLDKATKFLNEMDLTGPGKSIGAVGRGLVSNAGSAPDGGTSLKSVVESVWEGINKYHPVFHTVNRLRADGEELSRMEAQDARDVEKEVARGFGPLSDMPKPGQPAKPSGAFVSGGDWLKNAPSFSPSTVGPKPTFGIASSPADIAAQMVQSLKVGALRYTPSLGMPSQGFAPSRIGSFNRLQEGMSSFERLQASTSRVGSGTALGPSTRLRSASLIEGEGSMPAGYVRKANGAYRLPTRAERRAAEAAQKKENEKDTLTGTNNILGEISTILKDTLS